jgi:hypothetical protein
MTDVMGHVDLTVILRKVKLFQQQIHRTGGELGQIHMVLSYILHIRGCQKARQIAVLDGSVVLLIYFLAVHIGTG